MGIFKKIKKAVSKITKAPLKVVGLAPDMPDASSAGDAPVPAQAVEVAKTEATGDTEGTTESDKKKVKAGGKKSLSVARSSGSGINV